jgi:hypothetical protein
MPGNTPTHPFPHPPVSYYGRVNFIGSLPGGFGSLVGIQIEPLLS